MQHVQNLEELKLDRPSMVTIGVFDGVHRGHQHLVRSLVAEAHSHGHYAGVMTFDPHPDEVLQGPKGRYYLTTIEERAELLSELGADYVVTHPFNREVMQIRASDFVDRLVAYMRPSHLWVGEDFALGYEREGDVDFLAAQGSQKGFDVRAIPLVDSAESIVSSTDIRQALKQPDLPSVAKLLGRAYSVRGEVVLGKKRGRQLGYPTANIEVPPGKLIPANGVYAGWVTFNGQQYMAATNVGYSPTFGNEAVTVEAFLLDFDQDIYGETVEFSFERYLRPEMKFNGIDELTAQMAQDVAAGRRFLAAQQSP